MLPCLAGFSSRMAYYGVFDGHAGPRASVFAAENLHKNIMAKFPQGMDGHRWTCLNCV